MKSSNSLFWHSIGVWVGKKAYLPLLLFLNVIGRFILTEIF